MRLESKIFGPVAGLPPFRLVVYPRGGKSIFIIYPSIDYIYMITLLFCLIAIVVLETEFEFYWPNIRGRAAT